MGLGYVFKLWV